MVPFKKPEDKTTYQREYMRKRRAIIKETKVLPDASI